MFHFPCQHKRWIVFFALIIGLSILGLFVPESAEQFEETPEILAKLNKADIAWMIMASGLVMLMTPGLSFFYGGMVRPKNVISTMLQSVVCIGLISVLWVVIAFSLAFGSDFHGIIGDPRTFFMFKDVGISPDGIRGLSLTIPLVLYALFQMKFAIITPALITGSFAERVHFSGFLVFVSLFTIFVYAPLAHWTWHPDGILAMMGVKDFAGGIVVHASSGVAALAGAIYLGKRVEPGEHHPANIPMVLMGACLLWFGWFGFNGGSFLVADANAAKAFLNTNTASASAMLTWFLYDALLGRKPSAMGAAVGCVAGLVGITPCAGWVTVGESLFIGTITALVCNTAVHLRNKTGVDDALDVFSTHGVGGILGTILTGVFVDGALDGNWKIFWMHVLGVVMVVAYTFIVSYILYWVTDKMVNMRVNVKHEQLGLDRSQHGESYGILYEDEEHEIREVAMGNQAHAK